MTNVDTLQAWFDTGVLVRPARNQPHFLDLVHALARHAGIVQDPVEVDPARVQGYLPDTDHLVFLLVDGLGTAVLERLPASACLRTHCVTTLQSVFPSTTATAITALATGAWPSMQGVPGWWAFLPERDISVTCLPFVERFTGAPLNDHGVAVHDLFPLPSLWDAPACTLTHILPADIVNSAYTRYASGAAQRRGYEGFADGMHQAQEAVRTASGRSLTYVYLPQVDAMAHTQGPESKEVLACLQTLDQAVAELAVALQGEARLVISADHGLVTVPDEARYVLDEDDPLIQMLDCWPSCEPATPAFHVRPGFEERFAARFAERLGEVFLLLTPDEIEALQIMGPGPLAPLLRQRLGTFLAIAPRPALLAVQGARGTSTIFRGVHAGLRQAETVIPLVVV